MSAATCGEAPPPSVGVPRICLVALLLLATPIFLRMPLTNDALLFDLQSWLFSQGSVPYRDVLEPNLPGVFWIHSAVRGWIGTSSEALRLFDLVVIATVTWMLSRLSQKSGGTSPSAIWLGFAVLAFYLGASEWCHCQRDTWLLLPILAATSLRLRRLEADGPMAACLSFAEGLLWGAGVWLKPYTGLVAAAVWLVTLSGFRSRRQGILDTAWVLLGGLVAGASGIVWLVQTEAWPYWLETMRQWNPRYLAAGRENWIWPRFQAMAWRMQPWFALHVFALPLAVYTLRPLWQRLRNPACAPTNDLPRLALSAIYLATMAHVFLLQHLFDYVHAPAVILAVTVVGTWLSRPQGSPRWRIAVLLFGLWVLASSPLVQRKRVRWWWACVTQPSSPKLQDRLALLANPNRSHVESVAEFLQQQNPQSGDVCVFNSDLVGLYQRLELHPPTRYVYLFELLTYFPKQRGEILASVLASGHRFVVTDLVSCGMSPSQAMEIGPEGPNAPPPAYHAVNHRNYPWSQRVIFRSGMYLVHEIAAPLSKPTMWPVDRPLRIKTQLADRVRGSSGASLELP